MGYFNEVELSRTAEDAEQDRRDGLMESLAGVPAARRLTPSQIDRKIHSLKNQRERATTRPDPYGEIIGALNAEIARLEALKAER